MAMLNHWSNFILLQHAQRFATSSPQGIAEHGAGLGVDTIWEQEKLEATLREMLAVGAADWARELPANIAQPKRMSAGQSPASSARCVGRLRMRGFQTFG